MGNTELTTEQVLALVCGFYNVTPEDIASKSRKEIFSTARQMLCYILLMKLDTPKQVIKDLIGGRTTAAYLSEEGRRNIKLYPKHRAIYEKIWVK